jgi:hypothetical protein
MWEPRRLTTLWASTACYRKSSTFLIRILVIICARFFSIIIISSFLLFCGPCHHISFGGYAPLRGQTCSLRGSCELTASSSDGDVNRYNIIPLNSVFKLKKNTATQQIYLHTVTLPARLPTPGITYPHRSFRHAISPFRPQNSFTLTPPIRPHSEVKPHPS